MPLSLRKQPAVKNYLMNTHSLDEKQAAVGAHVLISAINHPGFVMVFKKKPLKMVQDGLKSFNKTLESGVENFLMRQKIAGPQVQKKKVAETMAQGLMEYFRPKIKERVTGLREIMKYGYGARANVRFYSLEKIRPLLEKGLLELGKFSNIHRTMDDPQTKAFLKATGFERLDIAEGKLTDKGNRELKYLFFD